MKNWFASEMRPGQVNERWLKTLARNLRDWLNGFLLEPDGSVEGDREGGGALSSERGDQTEAHPQGLAEDAGPPEAWLALVRERAPELFLPVEVGRAPWQELSSPAMEESKHVEERLSPSAARVPLTESRSSQSEERSSEREELHVSAPHGRANSVAPRKTTWLQSIKRKFAPGVSTSMREEEESRPRQERVASRPAAAQQSAKTAERSAPSPTPRWGERIKQEIQDMLHKAPTSESKVDAAEKEKTRPETQKESPASPSYRPAFHGATKLQTLGNARQVQRHSTHESGSPPPGLEAVRSNAAVGRGSSEPSATFRRSRQGFGEVKHSSDQSPKEVPASTMIPKRWPSSSDTPGNPAAPREEIPPSETDQGKFGWHALPTVPPTPDIGTLTPRHSPNSERDDPWPELPEDRPVATARSMEFLRNSERLRALDREQMGGR